MTPSEPTNACAYDECSGDSDCPGVPCECSDAAWYGHRCSHGGRCRVDGDCGVAGYCSPSYPRNCGAVRGLTGYFCHTPGDLCVDDADCAGSPCVFAAATDRWECEGGGPCMP